MMTRLHHTCRVWFGTAPFEILTGPFPEIEVGVDMVLAFGDRGQCGGGRQVAVSEKMSGDAVTD